MSMIIDDKFVALWSVALPGPADYLGTLRELEPGKCEFVYRFRYHKDSKAFGSADEKSWYSATIMCPRDVALERVRLIVTLLAGSAGSKADEILMGDDGPAGVMKQMMSRPWAHMMHEDRSKTH